MWDYVLNVENVFWVVEWLYFVVKVEVQVDMVYVGSVFEKEVVNNSEFDVGLQTE